MSDRNLPPMKKLALLARLEISDAEAERLGEQLEDILEHFETIQALDLTGVEANPYAIEMVNEPREDGPIETLQDLPRGTGILERLAPDREGDHYRVPKMIKES